MKISPKNCKFVDDFALPAVKCQQSAKVDFNIHYDFSTRPSPTYQNVLDCSRFINRETTLSIKQFCNVLPVIEQSG